MINYGSVYLVVKDFDGALDFYKKLFQKDVTDQNMTRFAIFNIDGLCLAIYNGLFDINNPDKVATKGQYCEQYDDMTKILDKENCGKIVINLNTDDLRQEYRRISELGIGSEMTEIRYINARMPYYYFSMKDLDGNTIEITGPYIPNSVELL